MQGLVSLQEIQRHTYRMTAICRQTETGEMHLQGKESQPLPQAKKEESGNFLRKCSGSMTLLTPLF